MVIDLFSKCGRPAIKVLIAVAILLLPIGFWIAYFDLMPDLRPADWISEVHTKSSGDQDAGKSPEKPKNPLGLENFINTVSRELRERQKNIIKNGELDTYSITGVQLEVSFVVTKGAEGGGEIDFYVVTAGGKMHGSKQDTQKVVLHLKPPDFKPAEPVKQSVDLVPRRGEKPTFISPPPAKGDQR